MKSKYMIINYTTMQFIETDDDLDVEWRENYDISRDFDTIETNALRIWSDNYAAGIPFVMDLSPQGGMFTLLVDETKHVLADIEAAKTWLHTNDDVATLWTLKLTPWRSNGQTHRRNSRG